VTPDWSPQHYLKFVDERTRPARDLLANVPLANASLIYDLGCGPGNSTDLLVKAFPEARTVGVDSSPAMIAKAQTAVPTAEFHLADLVNWQPDTTADLLFSNATFQWLPGHVSIWQSYFRTIKQGAVLAVQMPDNLAEPSHLLMREVAAQSEWAEKLGHVSRAEILSPKAYFVALRPLAAKIEIWHSIYNHPLQGVNAIVDWVTATGLKPYLDPLKEAEREDFLADYRQRIAEAYSEDQDGVCLLRFPRIFIVATA
jgi:trans-aconitate 2-methyltransferase